MERAHKIEMQWHGDTSTLGNESIGMKIYWKMKRTWNFATLLYIYNEKWFYTIYTDIINLSAIYDKKYFNSDLSFLIIITI